MPNFLFGEHIEIKVMDLFKRLLYPANGCTANIKGHLKFLHLTCPLLVIRGFIIRNPLTRCYFTINLILFCPSCAPDTVTI